MNPVRQASNSKSSRGKDTNESDTMIGTNVASGYLTRLRHRKAQNKSLEGHKNQTMSRLNVTSQIQMDVRQHLESEKKSHQHLMQMLDGFMTQAKP